MALAALLDANVLHPQILCDLLLRLAEHDAFRPLWSASVLAETIDESILRRRPDLDRARLQRRMDALNAAFPDACVSGYEQLLATIPEMGEDAHVLAAALHAEADVIVTDDVKAFRLEWRRVSISPSGRSTISCSSSGSGTVRSLPGWSLSSQARRVDHTSSRDSSSRRLAESCRSSRGRSLLPSVLEEELDAGTDV